MGGISLAPGASPYVYVPAEPFLRGHYVKYNGNNGHVDADYAAGKLAGEPGRARPPARGAPTCHTMIPRWPLCSAAACIYACPRALADSTSSSSSQACMPTSKLVFRYHSEAALRSGLH